MVKKEEKFLGLLVKLEPKDVIILTSLLGVDSVNKETKEALDGMQIIEKCTNAFMKRNRSQRRAVIRLMERTITSYKNKSKTVKIAPSDPDVFEEVKTDGLESEN